MNPNASKNLWGIRLLLLGVVCLVFGRILFNEFVDWDDYMIFGEFSTPHLSADILLKHWNPNETSNFHLYCPLIFTMWWSLAHAAYVNTPDLLDASLNPQIFHAANLLVHWLCACIVLEILVKLRFPIWAATIGALFFAIHPLQTEPVAWATGMKDLLSGLLALLTIWRFMIICESAGRKLSLQYAIATLIFICALLAKPSTVVVPLIAAVIARMIYRKSYKQIALLVAPWIALSLAMIWLTRKVQTAPEVLLTARMVRPLIAADALAFYLYKLALPFHLSMDYGRTPNAVMHDPALHHPLFWTWIFPLALAVLIWRLKKPMLTLGAWILLLGVLPVLGLLPFFFQVYSTVADRYFYVSMLGVAIVIAAALPHFRRRMAIAVSIVLLSALGCISFAQAGVWHDTEALYTHSLALNHTRWIHYDALGNYYDRLATVDHDRAVTDLDRRDGDEARKDFQEFQDHLQKAVESFQMGMAYDPLQPELYRIQIRNMVLLERPLDAIALERRLIDLQPQIDPAKREDLSILHGQIVLIAYRAKNFDLAKNELQQYPNTIEYLRKPRPEASDPDFDAWLNQQSAATFQSPANNK